MARVDQGPAGHAHPQPAQVLLRREVEAGVEPSLEGPHRHVRQPGQLLIGDGRVVMVADERQNRAEFRPWNQVFIERTRAAG